MLNEEYGFHGDVEWVAFSPMGCIGIVSNGIAVVEYSVTLHFSFYECLFPL